MGKIYFGLIHPAAKYDSNQKRVILLTETVYSVVQLQQQAVRIKVAKKPVRIGGSISSLAGFQSKPTSKP